MNRKKILSIFIIIFSLADIVMTILEWIYERDQ